MAVEAVNSPFVESSPTYSADGLELYIGSNRPNGQGDVDIWVVKRSDSRDAWQDPRNVRELNSPSHENPAWLSPNGLRLYYVTVVEKSPPYRAFTKGSLNSPFPVEVR